MSWIRFSILLILGAALSLLLMGTAFAQNQSQNHISTQAQAQAQTQTQTLRTQVRKSQTTTPPTKTIEGSWNLRLTHRRFQDEYNQQTVSDFRLAAELLYRPIENVYFKLAPKFTYTTGYLQTQEGTQSTLSTWGVKEASVNAEPWKSLLLSTGALDQSSDHPSLLLDEQSFPAARIKLNIPLVNNFFVGGHAETAVATSSSLSTQTKEAEKTPTYSSGSLSLGVNHEMVEAKLRVGAFEFQNLPMSVATKSTYLGNTTVSSTAGADSEFVNEYKGTFASGNTKINFSKVFGIKALVEWVQNSDAESSLNQGTRSLVGADVQLTKNSQISPFYEYFKIEPDAAVALYNGEWLNTNRVGYNGGLSYSYRKSLRVTVMGGERDVIYTSPFQNKEQTWFLRLETFDVAI